MSPTTPGAGFRWDDGLAGPARNIAKLDHTPIRVLAGPGTGKTFALSDGSRASSKVARRQA